VTATIPARMRTSVLRPDRSLHLDERPVPVPAPGEVLVRVAAVGVCGSDVHYWREGRIGDFVVEGDLVLGHELSGSVVAVGPGVDPARVGERVAVEPQQPCGRCRQCRRGDYNLCPGMRFYATPPVDGAFCEYITIGAGFAHRVPDTVSDEAAALLEPLSVCIAGARKAAIVPGSRVLIAGAGPIGLILIQVAQAFGAVEVVVSDPVTERRMLALARGATRVVDPRSEDVARLGLEADAFLDAAGATSAITAGIANVGPGGRVVLIGMGEDTLPLPVGLVQGRELVVTGIFRYTDTWPLAIRLVASGAVELDSLVTSRFPLSQAPEALAAATDPTQMKIVVRPGG
jgi:L-iditol 2-dehydrogenase